MAEETITKQEIEEAKNKLISKKTGEQEVQKIEEKEEKREDEEQKTEERRERIGILNIYTTFNNTLMTLTDLAGNTIARFSGGESTKQSRLKANPTIAMFVAQKIAEDMEAWLIANGVADIKSLIGALET